MDLPQKLGQFFAVRHVSLGWSLLWRLMLLMLPIRLLAHFVAERTADEGSAAAAGAASILFALPVGGNLYLVPLALPVMIVGLDWIGKRVAERRLDRRLEGFLGWSIYWRWALLQLAGLFALGLLLAPIIFLLSRTTGPGRAPVGLLAVIGLVGLPALLLWGLNGAGWSLVRAVEKWPDAGPVEGRLEKSPFDAPIHNWTDLFDRDRFGFNWLIAGAWALPIILMPWISAAVRSVISADPFRPPGLQWYSVLVLVAAIEGGAFAGLIHRLKSGWSLVLSMAAVSVALMLVEVATTAGSLHPWFVLSSAAHSILLVGGLVIGVRRLGAGFAALLVGSGTALLLWGLLVYPVVLRIGAGIEALPAGWYFAQSITRVFEALLLSTLLSVAVQTHLRSRGLSLRKGGIVALSEEEAPSGIKGGNQL